MASLRGARCCGAWSRRMAWRSLFRDSLSATVRMSAFAGSVTLRCGVTMRSLLGLVTLGESALLTSFDLHDGCSSGVKCRLETAVMASWQSTGWIAGVLSWRAAVCPGPGLARSTIRLGHGQCRRRCEETAGTAGGRLAARYGLGACTASCAGQVNAGCREQAGRRRWRAHVQSLGAVRGSAMGRRGAMVPGRGAVRSRTPGSADFVIDAIRRSRAFVQARAHVLGRRTSARTLLDELPGPTGPSFHGLHDVTA